MSPSVTAKSTGLRPSPPCAIVIFGAAGDLTKRKLLPALYNLKASGHLPRQLAIIGVARKEKSHEQFREEQSKNIREFATRAVDDTLWDELRRALYYQAGEFSDPEMYTKLKALLDEVAKTQGTGSNVLFYLATPPNFFGEIVTRLGQAGLARPEEGGWRRVIVEKPFGRDLDSARALNAELGRVLDESQIYRIDHYLGKETVQNIMVFRFANGLFEPVWDRRYVDHVQIMVGETVGVEDRGNYYETAGIVRDMIQNHMFQLLALVAMEPPTSFQADAVRGAPPPGGKLALGRGAVLSALGQAARAARHRDHDPVPAAAAAPLRRARGAGRAQPPRAPHPARRRNRDPHESQAPGAEHGAQHGQARVQLQAVRRDERGDGLRAAAVRQHGRRLDALPPGRHGRGGLAHRHADRGPLGVAAAARLPQLRRRVLGTVGRRHLDPARRPCLVASRVGRRPTRDREGDLQLS